MTKMMAATLLVAAQLGIGGAAFAAGEPVDLSRTQLRMQDQETLVLNLLSAQGYSEVGTLQRSGMDWTATATRAGKSAQLTVDPAAGTVKPM
jgi:hypothetical protein